MSLCSTYDFINTQQAMKLGERYRGGGGRGGGEERDRGGGGVENIRVTNCYAMSPEKRIR